MKTVDVGIGWANSVDSVFVSLLKGAAKKEKCSFFDITHNNIFQALQDIQKKRLTFRTFLDRGSFDHPSFMHISSILSARGVRVINNPDSVIQFASKAALHRLYVRNKLPVRKTFIISPKKYAKRFQNIPRALGTPFVLTPSVGGYENDVITNAMSEEDIIEFLAEHSTEDCLAQEYIVPTVLRDKIAWFRPIFACGEVIPLWWDPGNHMYQEFGRSKEEKRVAEKLIRYINKIARITGLELFSTEIAITGKSKYVIIDYANHPIDLNAQTESRDALPLCTLERVVLAIVKSIK